MTLTPAERARRYRQRQGEPFTPATCPGCGGAVGAKRCAITTELCRPCWEQLTPEGRQDKAERVRRARARQKSLKAPATS